MNIIWGFVCVVATSLSVPCFAKDLYSILQGATSENETHITVVARADDPLSFQARGQGSLASLPQIQVERATMPGHDYVVHRLKIVNLQPTSNYILEIINSQGQVTDRRKFKSLDYKKPDGRVAVGSCMVRQMHNPFLWNNLAKPENRPDLLIILGDIVYLDRANLLWAKNPTSTHQVWDEFVKARLKENLYFWENLVPTLSVWDDHDAGGDNVGSQFPLMQQTHWVYNIFMANDSIPNVLADGPGMAKTFQLFGKNFILLDSRTFREASISNPLFGAEQNRFLLRSLKAGPNVILSGTQFFGKYVRKDSLEYNWPEFAKEWTAELRDHAEWKKATLAFVSGDVHFSEVQDLEPDLFGYPTVEITSSNIHSFGFPGHYKLKPANPRRREVTGTHNIMLLEFPASESFELTARAMGWRGNDLFKTWISIAGAKSERKLTLNHCESLLRTDAKVAME